jgi:outer membrane protein OmpA-like peptidoglycan-associated protein
MTKLATLILSISFLCIHSAEAQIRVAIEGGAHLASVPGNNNPGWDTLNYRYGTRTGYHVGLLADLAFSSTSKFHLQSGMNFSNKGRKFSFLYDTTTSTISKVEALQYVNYMEMPLNLVFKINLGKKSRMIIGGGPYAAFLYNGRERKETYHTNGTVDVVENKDLKVAPTNNLYSNFEYGVNGLFGFEFGRVFLTANYSRGLSDFYTPANYQAEFRHEVMGGTLGIFLTNPAKKSTKQKDADKDGIPDRDDDCPTKKGDIAGKGCPDRDGDGVIDKDDKCPEFPGVLKHNGCPAPDSDKDGVDDDNDKCPDIAGDKKYNGCPVVDADKDGVNDNEDKCPNQAGSKKYGGCPAPDTDKDGVNDDEDKCPSAKGTRANNGCPPIKKELINRVANLAKRVQFNYRSTKLTSGSKIVLNEVVKILNENPELNVFIEGYTSSDGNPANHMKLSKARAESVRSYLESKGIDPERVKAEGFGDANPLNSGRTEFLRARNRRVELKLTYN